MPAPLRGPWEAAFGQPLGHLRVHDDAAAAGRAQALGAVAWTEGADIGFAAGRYRPGDREGRALLAHEVAHALQQTAVLPGPRRAAGARHEAQADAAAAALQAGRAPPRLQPVAQGVQRRIEMRDVGRGEASGYARLPELIDRLNAIASSLRFFMDGRTLAAEPIPGATESEFDRRMLGFLAPTPTIPLRLTTSEARIESDEGGPGFPNRVLVDHWSSGYVDIDDLLASDDLGLQTIFVHFLEERARTPGYARRIGSESMDLVSEGVEAEFQRRHASGTVAELAVLRDWFGDPTIRVASDTDSTRLLRVYRNARGDRIRLRARTERGVNALFVDVLRRDTGEVVDAQAYRALLAEEAAAVPVQPLAHLDQPGDPWEREAERVADTLAAGGSARPVLGAPPALQRLSMRASPTPEDAERDEAAGPVQRLSRHAARVPTGWRTQLAAHGPGAPLPAPLAADFGSRLGTDLSAVRVHTGAAAAALCDGIAARAFTHGRDLFFARGEYRPAEPAGRRVIAHELAHVLQQRGAPRGVQRLPALDHSSEDNVKERNVRPWGDGGPSGNDYGLQTDGGAEVRAWVAYGGQPTHHRYWCHGHSLGTWARWGYSVYSGPSMQQVIQDEYRRVDDTDARPGDLAVWMSMPGAQVFGHSAVLTQPVVTGGALDDDRTRLSSKNGGAPVADTSLAELKAEPLYGIDVGVFRRA